MFSLLFSITLTESFKIDNIFAIYDLSYLDIIIQVQLNIEEQTIFGKSIKYISFTVSKNTILLFTSIWMDILRLLIFFK